MNEDLLISLRKYRPREGNDPLENFITEAFAWLLKNHGEFSSYFLEAIAARAGIDSLPSDIEANWSTQANFNGVFPDMLAELDGITFIFENKAWAPLHENQLNNYRDYAKKHYDNSYLILISATAKQHDQDPDLALCWSDIHSLIVAWENSLEDHPGFIFNDFKRLLEYEGMGPPSPISHEAILSYYPASQFKSQVSTLIQRVEHADWKELVPISGFNLFVENKRGSYYGEAWGRIGMHLLGGEASDWRPGIFIGFSIDGEDHATKPSIPSKGPDFSIIIDFDESLHRKYPQHNLFQSFLTRMQSEVSKLNSEWDFYYHLGDQSIEKPNAWHPIHIRKPMLDLFRGTLTTEDQSEAFINSASEILQLIFRGNEVELLRNEFL